MAPDYEELYEQLEEEGQIVYSLYWDSDGPGGGADYEYVYRLHDMYYAVLTYEDGPQGPFQALEPVLRQFELNVVTNATQEIEAPELDEETLKSLLIGNADLPHTLTVNGKPWQVVEGDKLAPND